MEHRSIFSRIVGVAVIVAMLTAMTLTVRDEAKALKTTVVSWTRFPNSSNIGTTYSFSYGGAVYGAYMYASYTFSATRTDTAYFPFVIPYPKSSLDTTGILAQINTIIPTDSGNVFWGFQWSVDFVNWYPATPSTIRQDSSATATTASIVTNMGKAAGAWYVPWGRFCAFGKQPGGGKANKAGVIAKVLLLNTQ